LPSGSASKKAFNVEIVVSAKPEVGSGKVIGAPKEMERGSITFWVSAEGTSVSPKSSNGDMRLTFRVL
jgi:hypothetical protein